MKKQMLSISLQLFCFTLCFVLCSMFLLYNGDDSIVPQQAISVNNSKAKKTVILDAGHGGEDSGAVGLDETLEKDLNLSVCQTLSPLLICSGFDVVQTRTEDIMLGNGETGHKKQEDLRTRVDFAGSMPDAYFISIHMNKFPKEYCKGIQLFYSPNHNDSLPMATALHSLVKGYLQIDNKREIKNGSQHIYLLNRIQNPAILVECGFLSNPEELNNLKNIDYQKKIALLISAALQEVRQGAYSA